jgi:hypothetical protein
MKKIVKGLGVIMSFVTPLLRLFPIKVPNYRRLFANLIASLFLLGGFLLGCMTLYSFLIPYWGETVSLLALTLLFLAISLVLYIVGRRLRPKPSPVQMSLPFIEKTLKQHASYQTLNQLLPEVSPQILVAIAGAAMVVSYLMKSKKNEA